LFENIVKSTDELENLADCLKPVLNDSISKNKTNFAFFNGEIIDEKDGDQNDEPNKASEGEGSNSKGASKKKIHSIDGKAVKDTETRPTGTEWKRSNQNRIKF